MGRDWARLAGAIEAARDELGMTQVGLAKAAGVSESTIQNLEYGKARKRSPVSLPKVERALNWAPGSGETVLLGGDPVPLAPEELAPSDALNLPLRIQQELAEGSLVDTTVLDLTPLGSNARMIVVVKGEPDATPEQIRKDILAWAKARQLLEGIGDTDDPSEIAN